MLFAPHCVTATLIRPDNSRKTVSVLRDTGALQSLVCSHVLSGQDYLPIDECRLIRGVTGDVISVPLVQVTLHSPFCSGTYLCGLVSTPPAGVAVLVGNDLCSDLPVSYVNVVTRSQTAALRKQTESPSAVEISSADNSSADPESTNDVVSDPVTVESSFEDTTVSLQSLFNSVDREELIRLQQSDPDIATLFELADQPAHGYEIRDGVLLRLWRQVFSRRGNHPPDRCSDSTACSAAVPSSRDSSCWTSWGCEY